MIRRIMLVACLGTARAAGFSQSLVEQPDVSAETYTSDSGVALPNFSYPAALLNRKNPQSHP